MANTKARFIVWSKAQSPEDQAEFDAWYDTNLHLICEPEGILGASRWKVSPTQLPGQDADPAYSVVIYDIEDPETTIPRMMAHKRESNPVADMHSIKAVVVERTASYVKGEGYQD